MDMSTLIKTEHDNWKKRMMVETCGTYVLMNMGIGFLIFKEAEHRWLCFKAVRNKACK